MKRIIVPVVSGFEEIELSVVTCMLRKVNVDVDLMSLESELTVVGAHSISVICEGFYADANVAEYDGIILVGGTPGADNLCRNGEVIDTLKYFNYENKVIAAICAGPVVLREANIINNRKITSYPGFFDVRENVNFSVDAVVVDDNIVTSRSQATAFEFAIEILNLLGICKKEIETLNKKMQYDYFMKWAKKKEELLNEKYVGSFS